MFFLDPAWKQSFSGHAFYKLSISKQRKYGLLESSISTLILQSSQTVEFKSYNHLITLLPVGFAIFIVRQEQSKENYKNSWKIIFFSLPTSQDLPSRTRMRAGNNIKDYTHSGHNLFQHSPPAVATDLCVPKTNRTFLYYSIIILIAVRYVWHIGSSAI